MPYVVFIKAPNLDYLRNVQRNGKFDNASRMRSVRLFFIFLSGNLQYFFRFLENEHGEWLGIRFDCKKNLTFRLFFFWKFENCFQSENAERIVMESDTLERDYHNYFDLTLVSYEVEKTFEQLVQTVKLFSHFSKQNFLSIFSD